MAAGMTEHSQTCAILRPASRFGAYICDCGLEAKQDVPFPSFAAWRRIRGDELLPPGIVYQEREIYESQKAVARAQIKYTACANCHERFSDANCFTEAGWQETQLSGLCERCFDKICAEAENDEDGDPGSGA